MADTRAIAALTPQVWDDQFTTEFFQANPFAPYSGTSENNIIRMKEDFKSKRGNGITFEFITNLQKGTIFDRQPLRGHESQLGEYGDVAFWRMRKQGIALNEFDEDLAAIDLRQAAKSNLRNWADEDLKFEIIDRLLDVGSTCDVPFATASATDKNNWSAAQSDRVLYGSARSNYSTTFATGVGNVDSTNDKLTRSVVSLMKRMALAARPRITPIRVESMNRRFFVMFAPPFAFRDFKADTDTVQSTVHVIEKNQEIFLGGDREYDGVIVHEVDDIPVIAGVGNGGIDVAPVYLCGAEALGWALKQRYKSRVQKDDYQTEEGFGMIGKWGLKKLCYKYGPDATVIGKQRGIVTGFVSSVSD
jgi:hypothetical protein